MVNWVLLSFEFGLNFIVHRYMITRKDFLCVVVMKAWTCWVVDNFLFWVKLILVVDLNVSFNLHNVWTMKWVAFVAIHWSISKRKIKTWKIGHLSHFTTFTGNEAELSCLKLTRSCLTHFMPYERNFVIVNLLNREFGWPSVMEWNQIYNRNAVALV